MLTIFSVSAGMIGVCLTAIGLVKLVVNGRAVSTICDDLLVVDAALFGVVALCCYRALSRHVRLRSSALDEWVDLIFVLALILMIVVCGIFAWSLL
jgi:hypothetical protein